MERARIDGLSPADIVVFILAGRARFTVVSPTGTRFTFRVSMPRKPRPGCPHFVGVLTGPDNNEDYTYLGIIGDNGQFRLTAKSQFSEDAPSFKAFDWLWNKRLARDKGVDPAEVWHEGRCCRCGRRLTVPESIARGIGPECMGKMGIAA